MRHMRDQVVVVVPNQPDLGDIMIVVEFMKVFHEECIILNCEVGDAKSTILLWLANFLPSNKSLGSVRDQICPTSKHAGLCQCCFRTMISLLD